MSRYTGPRLRRSRRVDTDLPGLTRKTIERRPYPPGDHGQARRRRPSEYAMQLMEKQKLYFNYGLRERQLRTLVEEAKRGKEITGEKILELLERRLDNTVFRAGFAPTIPAARQLVNHGHIRVNGKRVDIASYRVQVDDVISVRNRQGVMTLVRESLANPPAISSADWLTVDPDKLTAKLTGLPGPAAVPFDVDVQLVVEYYSR